MKRLFICAAIVPPPPSIHQYLFILCSTLVAYPTSLVYHSGKYCSFEFWKVDIRGGVMAGGTRYQISRALSGTTCLFTLPLYNCLTY